MSVLRPVAPHADSIELQVMFVQRPVGDPLLGNTLWSQVDQISTVPAETQAALQRNGLRFGVAPSDPPHALQAVLGLTGRAVPRDAADETFVSGQSYPRRSGEELSVDAWPLYAACDIAIDQQGTQTTRSYTAARCVFRIRVERTQDGWARLEFTPEVHHGDHQMRPVAEDAELTLTGSQLIDPLYDQRFAVELNLGEMVLLGASGEDSTSLGHHFFRGGATRAPTQRLLIVRLADMKRVSPIYD